METSQNSYGRPIDARRALRHEKGLLSTELAILLPVLVSVAMLSVYAIQLVQHNSRAQASADAAARAASLVWPDQVAGLSAADAVAKQACPGATVTMPSPDPPKNLSPGIIVVNVTCPQRFASFAGLVKEPVRSVTAVGISAIEYWRASG